MVDMNESESNSFILDGLFGINDALFVQDTVSTVGTLDSVVRFQLGLFAALCVYTEILRLPHTYTT